MEEKDTVDTVEQDVTDDKKEGNEEEKSSKVLPSEKDKNIKKKLVYLFSTVGLAAFFCAFYYSSMNFQGIFFPIVMFTYMIALTVLVLAYIIYNRGFSRKGVTEDMLPAEWTYEQKRDFIENGEKRLQKSKWMLVFILALTFTFIVEAFVLFVV